MLEMNVGTGADQLGCGEVLSDIEIVEIVVEGFRNERFTRIDGNEDGVIRVLVAQAELALVPVHDGHRFHNEPVRHAPQQLTSEILQVLIVAIQDPGLRLVLPAATILNRSGEAYGQDIIDQWKVDDAREALLPGAAFDRRDRGLQAPLQRIEHRVLGDIANNAGYGTLAVERTLRSFEDLEAIQVHHSGVELVKAGQGERRLIEVHPDEGARSILVTQATHEDRVAARSILSGSHAGHRKGDVLYGAESPFLQLLAADGGDAHRDVDQALLPLLRRYDDFLESSFLRHRDRRWPEPDDHQ